MINDKEQPISAPLSIRQFQLIDMPQVWDVSIKAISATGLPVSAENYADFGNPQKEYIDNSGEFLVGEVDGRIVAIGGLKRVNDDTAEIKRMRTLPEHEGRGYGKKILMQLLEQAKENGYKDIHLRTLSIMERAIQMYEHAGFTKVGVVGRFTIPTREEPVQVLGYIKQI